MSSIRVHTPDRPDVLQFEDAPDPEIGPGMCSS
jgi:NADPH:quinone reductase-like Zn-dependent oxidoreductase